MYLPWAPTILSAAPCLGRMATSKSKLGRVQKVVLLKVCVQLPMDQSLEHLYNYWQYQNRPNIPHNLIVTSLRCKSYTCDIHSHGSFPHFKLALNKDVRVWLIPGAAVQNSLAHGLSTPTAFGIQTTQQLQYILLLNSTKLKLWITCPQLFICINTFITLTQHSSGTSQHLCKAILRRHHCQSDCLQISGQSILQLKFPIITTAIFSWTAFSTIAAQSMQLQHQVAYTYYIEGPTFSLSSP